MLQQTIILLFSIFVGIKGDDVPCTITNNGTESIGKPQQEKIWSKYGELYRQI